MNPSPRHDGGLAGLPRRALVALVVFAAALIAAPGFVDDYILSVLILGLYFALVGQAWNVMTGFCGQLSLGHALYIGLGAYTAGALFVRFEISPWIGLPVAMVVAGLAGALIGFLSFRFGIRGVYFALLTIAFAEFTRILFDHWGWVGGSSGLYLPVTERTQVDLWSLRGPLWMFYYVILAAVGLAFLVCRRLLNAKIGYYWLAIREDQEAAQAMGIDILRYKVLAVVVSAMMTAFGGVFYAFYYNQFYPETIFNIDKSIEILLGVIVGGIGTLFGPILGAFALAGIGEVLIWFQDLVGVRGLKLLTYGVVLMIIILAKPDGLWPWLRPLLGLGRRDRA